MDESELRFRMLAENLAQLAWMADPDGTITWYNQRWCDFAGRSEESLLVDAWTSLLHPDHVDRAIARIKNAQQSVTAWEDTSLLRANDGQYRWFLSRMTPITDDSGELVCWFCTSTDITEQKNSEQRLRSSTTRLQLAAKLAGFAIAEVDYVKDQIILTERFAMMYGLPTNQLVVSRKTVHDLFHPDDQQWLEQHIEDAIEQQKDQILTLDHRIVRPDGEVRWVSVRKQLIHDESGADTRVLRQSLVAAQDITDRKKTEAELENARRLAESANQAKSNFLANMSHEIRSPMTAILGFAELLEINTEEDRERVETIQRNGQFLLELINDILDLSKIEAGKIDIDVVDFSPTELVKDVYSLMSIRAAESRLRFNLDCGGPIPVRLRSDPIRLRQILINLVGNAIKFTDEGSVKLQMCYDEGTGELEFRISDTGIGIREEELTTLFRPFEQADSSMARKFGGSGLGLAISQRLAELLGGRIEVSSKLGVGSTFSVFIACGNVGNVRSFEVIESEKQQENGVASRDVAGSNDDPPSDGLLKRRILVVDDRRDIRFLTQHLVRKWGGDALLGETGREALKIIAEEKSAGREIDIILMDVQMPEMDGLTAVRTLRSDGFTKPIIALTANAMESDRESCLEAGYDDYLSKPIDTKRLLETLRRYSN